MGLSGIVKSKDLFDRLLRKYKSKFFFKEIQSGKHFVHSVTVSRSDQFMD